MFYQILIMLISSKLVFQCALKALSTTISKVLIDGVAPYRHLDVSLPTSGVSGQPSPNVCLLLSLRHYL